MRAALPLAVLLVEGAGSAVTTVAWHPYKALIATGSKDTTVRLWDPSTGKVITSL